MIYSSDDTPAPNGSLPPQNNGFMYLAFFIVDLGVQLLLSGWWAWALYNTTNQTINQALWSIGLALICFTYDIAYPQKSGGIFIRLFQALCGLTLWIWLTK